MPEMDASQNASPPATTPDSQDDNGGGSSNYEDLRGYALWAISYGIASAIALRTIDALTSSRSTGGHEIAQQKKEKEKTSSGNSNPPPSICHIVFPSVTLINPTTTTSSPDPEEETAAASASPNPKPAAAAGGGNVSTTTTNTSKGAKETAASASPKPTVVGEKETVGAAINRTIGSFFSQFEVENHPPPPQANKDHDRALAKAQAITTDTCKHVIDFYNDCLGGGSSNKCDSFLIGNKCDSYVDIMKKCHQMESHSPAASPQESQASTNNSDDVSAAPPIPTLRLSINLLLMAYHGCRHQKYQMYECEKYLKYIKEAYNYQR